MRPGAIERKGAARVHRYGVGGQHSAFKHDNPSVDEISAGGERSGGDRYGAGIVSVTGDRCASSALIKRASRIDLKGDRGHAATLQFIIAALAYYHGATDTIRTCSDLSEEAGADVDAGAATDRLAACGPRSP